MTIPSSYLLPEPNESIKNGENSALYSYLKEQNAVLKRMYEQLASGINGEVKSYILSDSTQWVPVLDGATTSGTFTYDHQVGWVLRQGIFVDCFFSVKWSSNGTAAGNLFLNLPYLAAFTDQKPFTGVVQPSGITYTGGTGMVITAISDTYRGEFWNTGTGFTSANQAVVGSGEISGHIRYIGQFYE